MAIIEGTLTTYDAESSLREDFTGGIFRGGVADETVGPQPALLAVSGSPLYFLAVANGPSPGPQAVILYNIGNGTLAGPTQGTIMYGTTQTDWLSTFISGAGNVYTSSVVADTTDPAFVPGIYTAIVPFIDAIAGSVMVNITVMVFVPAPVPAPGVGALALAGFAPTVTASVTSPVLFPGVGVLTIAGQRPAVIRSESSPVVRPAVGALTLVGYASVVTVSQTSPIALPGVGSLILAGFAPIAYSGAASANVTPGVGVMIFAGFAPTVAAGPQSPFLAPLAILPTWSTFDTTDGSIDGDPFTPEDLTYFS